EYLLLLPDHASPTTLPTRLRHRASHLAHNRPHIDAHRITFGGPMLSSHTYTADDRLGQQNIIGRIHLCRAAGEVEVWVMVAADPYATLGVWDLGAVEVVPMRVLV
ncbi:uncharacterized protein BO72DRAFT_345540, partial [Aspergillus fijiensis CBS 313.89]